MKSGTLFTLSGAGALFFLVLLVIRSTNPPGLAHFPLSSTLVQLQAAAITVIPFALGLALRRGFRLQRPERVLSQGGSRALLTAGIALLPVLYLALRTLLPENEYVIPLPFNNDRALFTSLILMTTLTGFLALLWCCGVWNSPVRVRPGALVVAFLTLQLALVLLFHGQLPHPFDGDEYYVIGTAQRIFADPDQFVAFTPHRNSHTWVDFPAARILLGAWLGVTGVGLLQGRFFWLLVGWLALPFVWLVARRLYGKVAAVAALALAGFVPLQYNIVFSIHFVPTVLIVAMFLWLQSRESVTRPGLYSFMCGITASLVVEGHVYGVVFTLVFLLFFMGEFLRRLQRGEGWRQSRFWSFCAGCTVFFLFWLCWHIVLPGITLAELPEILRMNLAWETLGGQDKPSWLYRLFSIILTQLWLNPFEAVLLALIMIIAVMRARSRDIIPVTLYGAGMVVILVLAVQAHFNIYAVFFFPLYSVLFGGMVARSGRLADLAATVNRVPSLSIGPLAVLLAVPVLFAIQTVEAAHFPPTRERLAFLHAMSGVGREMDALLPREDIVIAGERFFYMGMSDRLNYQDLFTFSSEPAFLRDDPRYWPLAAPRALVLDEGRLEEYPQLDSWLVEQDFQAVRCYATPGYGTGTTMLWFHPELEWPAGPSGCPDG